MRNTDGRGLLALAVMVVLIVAIGVAMMMYPRQPKMTPAGATGSLRDQLSQRTSPARP